MYWRHETVREDVAISANDTYRVDLPKYGSMGSILFRLSANISADLGAASGGKWRLVDFVSKVQILGNGSYPIKSLTGPQLHALGFFDERVMPMDTWRNNGTNTQFAYFIMNFGQYKYDPSMGLDLGNWNNVELQFTLNAASAELTTPALTITPCYLEEAGARPFAGFMRTEQWRSWTTVADETKYNQLDTEYRIRRLMLQSIVAKDASNIDKTNIFNLADNVRLTLDTGKVVLWDQGFDDLVNDNYYHYGAPIITAGFPKQTTDVGVDMGIGYVFGAVGGAGSNDGSAAANAVTIEAGRTDTTQKFEGVSAGDSSSLFTIGKAPFGCGMFKFDYDYDPNGWLDPNARKQVELNIHTRNLSDAAGGTFNIITDRYVPY